MEIRTQTELLSTLKLKHLLLDTSVFIDALKNPAAFRSFINELKRNSTTIVTLDVIKIEFLKGAVDVKSYNEKEEIINEIVDAILPINPVEITKNLYQLIQKMREDAKSASITDLIIGSVLMHHKTNLYLMTKNSHDFPTNIFTLESIINLSKRRTIQAYGVYLYK